MDGDKNRCVHACVCVLAYLSIYLLEKGIPGVQSQ